MGRHAKDRTAWGTELDSGSALMDEVLMFDPRARRGMTAKEIDDAAVFLARTVRKGIKPSRAVGQHLQRLQRDGFITFDPEIRRWRLVVEPYQTRYHGRKPQRAGPARDQ
jgi:hypothetical protein